jgi:hypothetical protein
MMRIGSIAALALALAACSQGKAPEAANGTLAPGPVTNSSEVDSAALPAGVQAIVDKHVPGMKVAEAERKEREGRIYYDVEGMRPDGSEVELDILQEGEAFTLVEVQRDLAWTDAPEAARTAAAAAPGAFAPERVIESTQPDGSVVYELFAPGKPREPAMEVQMRGGRAAVLAKRSAH